MAINWLDIARNNAANATGYSQEKRMGNTTYDCSSFVCRSLNQAGININPSSTTHDMNPKNDTMRKAGFEWHEGMDGVQEGDVVWKPGHTEFFSGNGKTIGAHGKKNGVSEYDIAQNYNGYWRYTGGMPASSTQVAEANPNTFRPSVVPTGQGFTSPAVAQSIPKESVAPVAPRNEGFVGFQNSPNLTNSLIATVYRNNANLAGMTPSMGSGGFVGNLATGIRYNPVGMGFGV